MKKLGSIIRAKRKALGLSQARLGELVGVSQTTVSDWENGDTTQIRDWKRLASSLKVDEQELLDAMSEQAIVDGMQRVSTVLRENLIIKAGTNMAHLEGMLTEKPVVVTIGDKQVKFESSSDLAALFSRRPVQSDAFAASGIVALEAPPQGRRDIPVFGKAQGGDAGVFEFNGEVLGWEIRPPMLEGVSSAYAVYVDGDSMFPRYKPGETVWINPNKVPSRGDDVIVQLHAKEDGDPPRGFIKEFVTWKPNQLLLHQYNPDREIAYDRWEVKSVHTIVFSAK